MKYRMGVKIGATETVFECEADNEEEARKLANRWAERATRSTLQRDDLHIAHRMGPTGTMKPEGRPMKLKPFP